MGTILASAIITKASTVLQDTSNVRWPTSELLGWLNDGQREVVLIKPSANVTNSSVQLTAGATKQTIPTAGIMFLDVTRNMGADGTSAGNAVRVVSREVLDAQLPTWHSAANTLGYIQHYTFDPRDPKTFYVYPKAPATAWYVDLIYSSPPTDCATLSSAISVDDIYSNALLSYVLYRAYSKDSEYAQNKELAVANYQAFAMSLGVKAQVEQGNNPNLLASPFNPNVPGSASI